MQTLFGIIYKHKIPHFIVKSAVYIAGVLVPEQWEYTLELDEKYLHLFNHPKFGGKLLSDENGYFLTMDDSDIQEFKSLRKNYFTDFDQVDLGSIYQLREKVWTH